MLFTLGFLQKNPIHKHELCWGSCEDLFWPPLDLIEFKWNFWCRVLQSAGSCKKQYSSHGVCSTCSLFLGSSSGFFWSCIVPVLFVGGEKAYQLTFDRVIFLLFFFLYFFKIFFLHFKLMGHLIIHSFAENTFWRKLSKAFNGIILFLYV